MTKKKIPIISLKDPFVRCNRMQVQIVYFIALRTYSNS